MPLIQSASKEAVGKNIKTEEASGNVPRKQAIAIALNTARRNGANIPPPNRRRYQTNMRPS